MACCSLPCLPPYILAYLNSFPGLTLIPCALSPNSFICHTSGNLPLNLTIATLPKARVSNPCVCHTSETPGGALTQVSIVRNPPAFQLSGTMRYPLANKSAVWIRLRLQNISAHASKSNPVRAAVRKAALLPFVFVMYAYATGGPFGLEDMVTTSGPGLTLLYHLFIPFFWCIPVSLVAAELTTAIPVEGGFYRWVRAAFGDFWGFQAGWWNWSASFLLAAAYAVLATDYLSFYFPVIVGWKHHMVSVLVVAVIAWINVRGIQMVGAVSTVLSIFVLLAVAALCAIAATKWHHNPFSPLVPPHVPPFQVFGAGLALGLWLYSSYEQVSSVAEEVENPRRNYPIALAIVVPLSMATYFLPTMFSLAALGDWQKWHNGYF